MLFIFFMFKIICVGYFISASFARIQQQPEQPHSVNVIMPQQFSQRLLYQNFSHPGMIILMLSTATEDCFTSYYY